MTADILFVGATRPAMAMGVPYAALLANAFITLELFLVSRNLLCLAIALPLHGFAWTLCLVEPRMFELLAVWAQVRARAGFRGRRAWGVVAYGPFHRTLRHRASELRAVLPQAGGP
ncbi:MAG: VirB3 family type IV secretion system protein [Proteobacteria bacterium]|nr:VirB3 family type IV secretion system protein [Pseudomonadota bacterium]